MTARDTSVMLPWNPGDAPGLEAIVCGPCTYREPRYQDVPVAFSYATACHWMCWHIDMHAVTV